MNRKQTANFPELARRILAIADNWKQLQRVSSQPDGTLQEIATLLSLCFGPDDTEAIARELIREIEIFDTGDEEGKSSPEAGDRNLFLTKLLRNEFAD